MPTRMYRQRTPNTASTVTPECWRRLRTTPSTTAGGASTTRKRLASRAAVPSTFPAIASPMLTSASSTAMTAARRITLGVESAAQSASSRVTASSTVTITCSHGPGWAIPWSRNAEMIASSSRP